MSNSVVNTRSFTYDNKTFTAYISDLPESFGIRNSICLISEKTNDAVDFLLFKTDRSAEETEGWWFQPSIYDISRNPKLNGVKVLIIND
jgi:hypothetical protein